MTIELSKQCTLAAIAVTALLGACTSTNAPKEDKYALYRELMPRSILVLPPINESVNVNAPYSWLTTATKPLAELGYYVFPVAVIDQFMKENGLPNPEDMHGASLSKMGEIFGADAVLYVTLEEFGQKFELLSSTTRINARAELVDVKTAQPLWRGLVRYSDSGNSGGSSIMAQIVAAAITQIGESITDSTHDAAPYANYDLFEGRNGLLKGPRNPGFEAQMEAARLAAEEAAAEVEVGPPAAE